MGSKKTAKKAKNEGRTTPPSLTEEDRSSKDTLRDKESSERKSPVHGTASARSTGSYDMDTKQHDLVRTLPSKPSKLGILLRFILVDLPLVTLFGTYVFLVVMHHVHDEYLVKQAELMKWTDERRTSDMTYYNRLCTAQDISTFSTDDLIVSNNASPEHCMHHMAKHGVSLYPHVLAEDTADELRDFIVERNKVEEGFWVISGEHRFTFGVGVNQAPIVTKALEEIASHPVFRPAIEEICGPNPAVIEFTAITRYE